ncbi:ciliary microtubule inner protein 5 [Polymixia lowei]
MELNKVRRVSSAGYRLPERPSPVTQNSVSVKKPPDKTRDGDIVSVQDPDNSDPVKQDQVWREFVQTEMRGVREWEKNWSFLKNYDQMGHLKTEKPLPSQVSLFSDCIPNTTNRTFGSRLSTPLGRELMRMDRLFLWSGSHHKSKQDPEMLPC